MHNDNHDENTHLIKNEPSSFLDEREHIDIHHHRTPHWQQGAVWNFVTWRLADSLPNQPRIVTRYENLDANLAANPPSSEELEEKWRYFEKIESLLDEGKGLCFLNNSRIRSIVDKALMQFNGERYDLAAFVCMPNHVHVLFRLQGTVKLEDIIHAWKSYTSKKIKMELIETHASDEDRVAVQTKLRLWQSGYWDRIIRSEKHFFNAINYIYDNPIKARLHIGSFSLFIGSEY